MDLAEFVRQTMKEKKLSQLEIERNSGKLVTDTTVATILAGKATNPSLKMMLGLAKGLGVHPVEVFKAAAGMEDPEEWSAPKLIRAMQRLTNLKSKELKTVKRLLDLD